MIDLTEARLVFRAALHQSLLQSNQIPPQHVDEVTDLAIHAAFTALEAVHRIALNSSPNPQIGVCAYGPALSIVAAKSADLLEQFKQFAADRGMPMMHTAMGSGQ